MVRNIYNKLLVFGTLIWINIPSVFASSGTTTPDTSRSMSENLLPEIPYSQKEIEAVNNLPKAGIEQIVSSGIRYVLAVAMILALIAIVVAGIMFLSSNGDEDKVTKAKNILIYLVVGILIMAAAYGIVVGIAQFEFIE